MFMHKHGEPLAARNKTAVEPFRVIAGRVSGRRRLRDLSCAPARKWKRESSVQPGSTDGVYRPEILAMLYRVWNESVGAFADGGCVPADQSRGDLHLRLARVLIDALENGVSHPDLLKEIAITTVVGDFPPAVRSCGTP
jgi:hypothetical protein